MSALESSEPYTFGQLAEAPSGSVTWIQGPNFSGRTAIIQKACQFVRETGRLAIDTNQEIDPTAGINVGASHLTETVGSELDLHCQGNAEASALVEEFGLQKLVSRRLPTLSGGEQSILLVICKLALRPHLLGLDGTLEQLDSNNLSRMLSFLTMDQRSSRPQILISHNSTIPPGALQGIRCVAAKGTTGIERRSAPPPLDISSFHPELRAEPRTIVIRHGRFRYRNASNIFSDLNLTLKPGLVYRFAGPNGCGKSTLARLLNGYLRLNSGEFTVNGQSFDPYPHPGTLAQLHFQSPDTQLFAPSVRQELKSLPPDVYEAAVEFAGLKRYLDSDPFDLPFVLRKRLSLTLILHAPAPWLIFDEPTLGQDEQSRSALKSAFRLLAASGHGVIVVSHNDEFANSVADATIDVGQPA